MQLLGELAKRLGRELRDTDMLSRISGDEFLLLLSPVQSQAEVAEFFESALQRLSAPFFIDGSEIFASTSVGVSLYPDHGESYDTLCQNADLAMYRVKNDGKGKAAFFDVSMEHEALRPHEGGAVAAARHPREAVLLRLPDQGRHPHPGDQGHRGAGAAARP